MASGTLPSTGKAPKVWITDSVAAPQVTLTPDTLDDTPEPVPVVTVQVCAVA